MLQLDCTLNQFLIPNIPLLVPPFGTKKTGVDEGLASEEVHSNIALPFELQRPFRVAEVAETSIIEANTSIALLPGCTAINLADGDFIGVRVVLINLTPLYVQIVTAQETGWILPYQTIELAWYDDCWYVCDGHMVGEIVNVTFPLDKIPFGYLTLHSRLRPLRTAYKRLANTILYPLTDVPFTCTTANPSVFTKTAHGFVGGERLRLFNDEGGSLTGPVITQDYFVERIGVDTYYLVTAEGGATRLAITAQSGTHYYQCSAYGVGDGSTTFDLIDPNQAVFVGAGTGTSHNIASVDTFLRGQFKDDRIQNLTGSFSADSYDGFASGAFSSGYRSNAATCADGDPLRTVSFDASRVARTGTTTRTKQLGTNYLIKY